MGDDRLFDCSDCSIVRFPGTVEASALVAEIAKTADFLVASGGGVTFSGGEPLCQPDFICEIIDLLRNRTIEQSNNRTIEQSEQSNNRTIEQSNNRTIEQSNNQTCPLTFAIETSGFAPLAAYQKVVSKLDLVLQDVKFGDLEGYRQWTKVDATPIFRNLEWLKTSGVPFIARIPTMPGVNDTPVVKEQIARRLAGAPNLERIELLPYNVLAGSKYAKLGRAYEPGFDEHQAPDLSVEIFARHGLAAVAM